MAGRVSRAITYLTPGDVLRMHQELMEGANASSALLDGGKLESAVQRAENVAYYEDGDIAQQAAYLATGIALAHAFQDGNKRLAYASCLTFLRQNDLRVDAPPKDIADALLAVVNRGAERLDPVVMRFATYLREHLQPVR